MSFKLHLIEFQQISVVGKWDFSNNYFKHSSCSCAGNFQRETEIAVFKTFFEGTVQSSLAYFKISQRTENRVF